MIDFCILGSGVSGSTIANLLSKRYSIQILEKAKGIGGRSSTSKMGNTVRFDHGLQYYSPKDLEFKKFVNRLVKKKILKLWNGDHLDFTFKNKESFHKIIGAKGNNDLNKFLLKKIKKNFNQQITNIRFNKTHWDIYGKNKKFKAKSIIITFPFPQTKKLVKKYLSKNFLKLKVKMTPNITLLVKQKSKLKIPISSVRLDNKIISWISNENSKKRFLSKENHWTVQTSENYSTKIINVYKNKKTFYSKQIIREFCKILNLDIKSLKIIKIHGWKYSWNKIDTGKTCFWDKKLRIGICGDWFIGPKADAAWMSANSLYQKIKKNPPKKF